MRNEEDMTTTCGLWDSSASTVITFIYHIELCSCFEYVRALFLIKILDLLLFA